MKTTKPFFTLLFLFIYSFTSILAQKVTIGTIDTIESKILGEKRTVWVYVPDDNQGAIFAKKNYPVVYLLDGDAHFYSVVGMIHQLSSVNGNTICPKMIVVGIPNTNRTRDLTPTKGDIDHPFSDSTMVANSGGGEKFMSFIEKELFPAIESKYPTLPYRMFIGHSFGGITVMNTLIHKPHLFNSYVSLDPSMWWDKQSLLNTIAKTTFGEDYSTKSLYLGIANTMSRGMEIESVKKDTSPATEHIRALLKLDEILTNNNGKQLKYRGKYYPEDDHGSVPLIAEYDALRFIFDFYKFQIDFEDFMDEKSNLMNKLVSHYNNISKEFGEEIKPDEQMINAMGYQFMNMGQFEKSEQFFKLNITNYPESFNTYDSIGDLYSTMGEKDKAIENYKKSISLNPDSFSKPKLEALEKE